MKNNSKNLVKINEAEKLLTALRMDKSEKRYEDAVDKGLSALKLLGISIKVKPSKFFLLREINRTKKVFTKRRIKRIATPEGKLSHKIQLQLVLLSELVEPTLKMNEDLWYVILMRIARISIKKGNSEVSVIGYAGVALISVRFLEDDHKAELIYNATMKLLEKHDDHRTSAIARFILGAFVCNIYEPWIESLQILDEGARDAVKGDEPVIGALCISFGIEMAFASGIALSEVQTRIDNADALDINNNSHEAFAVIDLYHQFIECVAKDDCDAGPQLDLPVEKEACFHIPLHLSEVMLQVVLNYNQGRFTEALNHIEGIKKELDHLSAHCIMGILYGYEVLTLTAVAPEASRRRRSEIKRRVKYVKTLFEYWVNRNPYNYGQMYKIIVACSAQLSGNFHKGEVAFEKAIELSEKKGALLDEAVAFVALARHCRLHGKEHMATYYMMEGARVFGDWQGNAIRHKLLISEKFHLPHEAVKDRWQLSGDDMHSLVAGKAMALTEQLTLAPEGLLSDYCKIVSDAMTCEKVLVFSDHSGVLRLEAMKGVDYESGTACDIMDDVSVKVIKQVFRHNAYILVNSDKGHELAKYDGYIMDHGTGCILSVPIAYEGSVVGVLYAERPEDFMEDDCAVVLRLTEHVAYLRIKNMSKDKIKTLPELSEEEWVIFEQVRSGKTIKEISDMYSTPLNQVLTILSRLYDKLEVDNLYAMQKR